MKRILFPSIFILLFGFASTIAVADPITLSYGDAYFVGVVSPGTPANETFETGYVNYLITVPFGNTDFVSGSPPAKDQTYDRTDSLIDETVSGALPPVSTPDFSYSKFEPPPSLLLFPESGAAYILGKYDAGNSGSLVWYVDDITTMSVYSIPTNWGPLNQEYGLSHTSVFWSGDEPGGGPDPIPEPTTLMLLGTGIGLLGLAAWRRKKR